jgi:integrase/recombinase XerD
MAELRLLFHYYHNKDVEQISEQDIMDYMMFIKTVHGVGRAKCRSVAQSCSFFYKHVIKMPFVLPSKLYPRKEFVLPSVMTHEQIKDLVSHTAPKLANELSLVCLYGCGLRLGEVQKLKLCDIERASNIGFSFVKVKAIRIVMYCYRSYVLHELRTLLPSLPCRQIILFESKQLKDKPLHPRSVQTIVNAVR